MRKKMVAIVILVIGAAAIFAGASMWSASRKARGWPVAAGTITERAVGPSTTTGASRPGRYVEPKVTYTYTVDGKPYTGHRIALTTNAYDEAQAKKIVDALPDRVDVHYNPADPSDAVLQTSSIGLAMLALAAGVIGIVAGAAMLLARTRG
ncbi:MAG TPA: DUF3592 domain-containing protein [Kofleriaceae bacterium]|nr:DUF3592 domain-containing protein [Kofleriaceae bacterium]